MRDRMIKIFFCGDESLCWYAIWFIRKVRARQYVYFPFGIWRGGVSDASLERARLLVFKLAGEKIA